VVVDKLLLDEWNRWFVSNVFPIYNMDLSNQFIAIGLGLGPQNGEKKGACPARVAEAGQENIETVHEPKPIQAADTL
jgi:hypothetical protein